MSFCKHPVRQKGGNVGEICKAGTAGAVPVHYKLATLQQTPAQVLYPRRAGLHVFSVHNVHVEHFNLGG